MGFLTPLYPIIMQKFGLSLSLVGTISMVAALASAFAQPLFGTLFDRFHITAAVYLAPLLTGLLVSCLGIAPSYGVFLAASFPRQPRLRRVPPQGRVGHPDPLRRPSPGGHGTLQRGGESRLCRGSRGVRLLHRRVRPAGHAPPRDPRGSGRPRAFHPAPVPRAFRADGR